MSNKYVKHIWAELSSKLGIPTDEQERLWQEMERQYNAKGRHYHNQTHIEKMLQEFETHEAAIQNKDSVLISIFYHDLIYKPSRKDNERQSAEKMKSRLSELSMPSSLVEDSYRQILQTKTHQLTNASNTDDAYLLDFDLEVLSRQWADYKTYTEQIRKEYSMYPTFMYKKGRKAAMLAFLERASIYHTAYYKREKEAQARQNIMRELEELLG